MPPATSVTNTVGLRRVPSRRRPSTLGSTAPLHTGLRHAPPRQDPPLPSPLGSAMPLPAGLRHASSPPGSATPLPAAPPPYHAPSHQTPPRLLPASHRVPLRPSPLDVSASALLAFPTELPFQPENC
ncbi:hypothetical protein GUJ93_ZPchr0009g2341 [Zizania palustris]|uniref:Uncharacterized protein n=1 Tax=Zizania palustris TaxID=103762 RepID=A0A8J5UZ90_ZIZPA|nr:hypothetical protein GUJ93_ZPchr0009g2341 [Zizania palustris]